jgi:heptosyltransferase-2
VGRCSFIASAAAIKHCRVLLTNDSAPMHVASAVGVPVVSVWCATIPEFGYRPWGVEHHTFEVQGLPCRPCGRHGHNYCPTGTHACQLQISTSDVLNSVLSYIDRSGSTMNSGSC